MILIFLIDYFNNKIIDKRDMEKRTEVPIIGFIGHNDTNPKYLLLINQNQHLLNHSDQ